MTEGIYNLHTGEQVQQNNEYDRAIAEFDQYLSTK